MEAPPTHFFFFNDTATTEIYTLSLHDALPIYYLTNCPPNIQVSCSVWGINIQNCPGQTEQQDRKSTRLNSSHSQISYAVFCLKKKKNRNQKFTMQQFFSVVHAIACCFEATSSY